MSDANGLADRLEMARLRNNVLESENQRLGDYRAELQEIHVAIDGIVEMIGTIDRNMHVIDRNMHVLAISVDKLVEALRPAPVPTTPAPMRPRVQTIKRQAGKGKEKP